MPQEAIIRPAGRCRPQTGCCGSFRKEPEPSETQAAKRRERKKPKSPAVMPEGPMIKSSGRANR